MPEDYAFPRMQPELTGVPAALLWSLYQRATASQGSRPALIDPWAVDLVERLDDACEAVVEHGRAAATAQVHAMRVSRFDTEIRDFLVRHPRGTVVALGEGLETQFHRVDNGRVRWVTVERPEVLALRRKFLPDGPRRRSVECDVTDPSWMEGVEAGQGLMITAQGLFMYLERAEVAQLLSRCAERFPGASLLFDAVPGWLLRARGSVARWYRGPGGEAPWKWGLTPSLCRFLEEVPGMLDVYELPVRGRNPLYGRILPALRDRPVIGRRIPVCHLPVFRADFD